MTIWLRPLTSDDLDALFSWESDRVAARMAAFTRKDPSDREAFDEHYRRILGDDAVSNWVIMDDDQPVGAIASFTIEGDRGLTYWIDRSRWGRGLATEAVRHLLIMEPVRPLFARVAAGNHGSRRVLEKAGFDPVGEETSYAAGVDAEIVEAIYRLDERAEARNVVHHVELWTQDLASSAAAFGWLLGELGWREQPDPTGPREGRGTTRAGSTWCSSSPGMSADRTSARGPG